MDMDSMVPPATRPAQIKAKDAQNDPDQAKAIEAYNNRPKTPPMEGSKPSIPALINESSQEGAPLTLTPTNPKQAQVQPDERIQLFLLLEALT